MNYQEFSHVLSVLNLMISLQFGTTKICSSQRGTLRCRKVKQLLQDHTLRTQRGWSCNPLTLRPRHFTEMACSTFIVNLNLFPE